jgi:hypothetical protein
MIERSRLYYHSNVYSPERILELLDMNGGQLSYQGIDLLRSLETNDHSFIKSTLLLRSSTIRRVCKIFDKYAHQKVPFQKG